MGRVWEIGRILSRLNHFVIAKLSALSYLVYTSISDKKNHISLPHTSHADRLPPSPSKLRLPYLPLPILLANTHSILTHKMLQIIYLGTGYPVGFPLTALFCFGLFVLAVVCGMGWDG